MKIQVKWFDSTVTANEWLATMNPKDVISFHFESDGNANHFVFMYYDKDVARG